MIVSKTFFRILKKSTLSILLPLALFFGISLAINLSTRSQNEQFQKTKATVALINRGPETVITKGLRTFIDENMNLISIDEKFIDDSIFYRQADFIAIIEADGSLEFEMIYDANFGYLAKNDINQFYHDVELYQTYQSEMSDEEIVNVILENARMKVPVEKFVKDTSGDGFVSNYFNALTYIIMLLIFNVIGKNLLIFNRDILRERADVSSMSSRKHGTQLLLSTILAQHALMLIAFSFTYFVIKDKIGTQNIWDFFLIMYLFSWCTLAMSFFMSRLISSEQALTAAVTGVSLGLAFISGAFVPQAVLSPFILNIAKISPVYWTIEINEKLNAGVQLGELLVPICILIAFAVDFVLIALLVSRQKKNSVKSLTFQK